MMERVQFVANVFFLTNVFFLANVFFFLQLIESLGVFNHPFLWNVNHALFGLYVIISSSIMWLD